ncbi:MAG: hypothetical protein R6U93_05000 [Dehalococcoidia bacterium]
MARNFSSIDKTKWLQEYEGGKPEISIAGDAGCDVRTVKKGIDEARRERDARVARIELLKDAMSKHHETLLGRLGDLSDSLQLPPWDWAVLSWHDEGESVFSERSIDIEDTQQDRVGKRPGSSDIRGEKVDHMLKQHLKNDKLWRILARRERAHRSHRLARVTLQHKVADILEQETGYSLESASSVLPPYLCSYTTGDLFYRMTLRLAFGDYKNDAWQDDIVVDAGIGYVKYLNLILAEVPERADECREKLLRAFQKMRSLPEIRQVATTYQELEESTFRAKQAIEEIRLSGLVPGQCKVCRHLGM